MAQQSSNYYFGLLHTPLGDATLQTNTSGRLVVSGIGTTGNDGVQIFLGGGGGATVNLGVFNPESLPANASLRWATIGRSDGRLQQIDVKAVAGGGAIFADFTGLGAPAVSVALYSNDTLVAFGDGIPPTVALATFTTSGTPGGGGLPLSLSPCILNPESCYGNLDINLTVPNPTGPIGSWLTIPGQGPMYCTHISVDPGYCVPCFLPKYRVQATTVTGTGLGSISLDHEGYVYVEHQSHPFATIEHNSLGQAQFNFDTPGVLVVSNLGPSGLDGVDVSLRNVNTYGVDMVALNPQPLPPVSSPNLLTMSVSGLLSGGAQDQSLATMQILNQQISVGLQADFSSVGSPAAQVELWQGCELVSSYSVPNGGLALASGQGASGVSVGYDPDEDPCGNHPLPPWWWWFKWLAPVQVTTPGGQTFTVDHVRIAPESSTPGPVALTHVTFQTSIAPVFNFLSERALRLGVNFDGNQHFPMGQASLGVTATGLLNLSSPGPLQTASMEIPLYGPNWFALAPLPPHIVQLLSYEFHSVLDDVPDRVAATVSMTGTATGDIEVTGDLSPLGATRYTMFILDGGNRVAAVTNQPAGTFTASSNCVTCIPSLRCDIRHPKCYIKIKLPKLPNEPGPVVRVGPALAVIGDEVIILPEDASRCAGPQNRLLLTGTGADSFQFISEDLGLFGNGHIGLGTATLLADAGMLTIGHIGSGGNNGVGINLTGSLNALANFAPLDFSAVQGPHPIPWIQASLFGGLGTLPAQTLGSLRFTSVAAGGGAQVTADFSPIGAATQTIEVWSGGQLVQSITGHTGNVGSLSDFPTGLGERSADSPTGAPGCSAVFAHAMQIAIEGGITLQGDELRVFPENPSQPIGALQALNLVGSGFDSFAIVGETTTPAVTPIISGISSGSGSGITLAVPTLFGYDYTVEAVNDLGPRPFPWTPVTGFLGDGSVMNVTLPADQPQQFFRLSVQGSDN
jgi:hypothetical protein